MDSKQDGATTPAGQETLIARFFRQSAQDGATAGNCRVHGDRIHGDRVQGGTDDAEAHDYPALWRAAQAIRRQLRARGLRRGDIVALAIPSSLAAVATLLAAWAEALAISIVPHELSDRSGRMAPAKLRAMLELLRPALLVATDEVRAQAGEHAAAGMSDAELRAAMAGTPLTDAPLAAAADLAILQFTSGSSGLPKAVMVDQAMLAANCAAIAARIGLDGRDRMVSWLPLNHDMGLSAVTLALWGGIDLMLIPTQAYARQPLVWLDCLSRYRGTLSPAPASAYALMARFAPLLARRNLDLSAWRYGWAGAEPVFDHQLRSFQALLAPYGLAPAVVQPAYGMAETVVATSLNPPGRPYRVARVDRRSLESDGLALECAEDAADALVFAANGKPVDGLEIRVVDEAGHALPERRVGQLQVRGSSALRGYYGQAGGATCPDGWYATGDIGFLVEGEVHISGRAKDLITRAGLNISPHHVEQVIERELALRPGSAAVFSVLDMRLAQERVYALIVGRGGDEAAALRLRVARAVVDETGLQLDAIEFVGSAELPRTTSGKIQRSALRQRYSQAPQADPQPDPRPDASPKPESEALHV
ncbi:AMP-binding protein [Chitinimonas koreensis]|uniref:AMP-binding protein n=1 Tax=Chitinimonas koreensis TaxID=356302 RepID=UPI0004909F1B|nr:AMP-binding protein [Chitinimonas koreensis]QNM98220.1 AMP-binding protein [Chitinimonas koreensis]